MAEAGDTQPEIKFRWCRTVRCRTQVVYLVLTSITGTQVPLTWQADLGWYESAPTPIPCGFHTGFILVKERVRDFVRDTLETREDDYKVDPFHIVPHKFAVELFLESDEATSFWSEAPELRLRYLSSDHLEKLGTSSFEDSHTEETSKHVFSNRKWVSSTSLHTHPNQFGRESSSLCITKSYQDPRDIPIKHSGSLGRGKSHSQLSASSIPSGGLYSQSKASTSSPNLSKAFQVAVDLSRASSKFLAGVSSTSSGVFLGYEDGSEIPSPENGNYTHTDSAYAAGGETSQDSESGGGARRRKKSQFSRGRSLQLDDLVGDESWRPQFRKSKYGLTDAPSSSFEDLLDSLSASKKAAVKSEINLMRFETLKRERLVQELLHPSDSDFEEEEAPCETSNPDLQGPYQCVITFESRSTSMDDVGSPRALEDVLVSLTSSESHPETSQPQPLPRTVLQSDLSDNATAIASESEVEDKKPTPKPRTLTPINVDAESKDSHTIECEEASVDVAVEDEGQDTGTIEDVEASAGVEEPLVSLQTPQDEHLSPKDSPRSPKEDNGDLFLGVAVADDDLENHDGDKGEEASGVLLDVTDPKIIISDTDDDNFQYDSLKHEDNENLRIDIRNIDSEESLDILLPKIEDRNNYLKIEAHGDEACDSRTEEDESEVGGLYEVEGAEAAFSSIDGEVPTDSVTLVPLDSYKGTVREVKDCGVTRETDSLDENEEAIAAVIMEKPTDETFVVEVTDMDNDGIFLEGDREYIDNEETDRSETEAIFNVTDVSRLPSVERESENPVIEGSKDEVIEPEPNTSEKVGTHSLKTSHQSKTPPSGDISVTSIGDNGYREPSKCGTSEQEFIESDVVYKGHKVMKGDDMKGVRRHSSDLDTKYGHLHADLDTKYGHLHATGISTNGRDEENSENHKPYIIRPHKLLNTGTQTSLIRQISRTTSMDLQKSSESDTSSSNDRFPLKYSRSPLRNRTNGQAEPYTPLPDRLSGPWSQRFSASASNARSSSSPSPFAKPDLVMLQRNLYNLVQGDEAVQILQNSVHLQKLRNHHHSHGSQYQSKTAVHDHVPHRTTNRTTTSNPPLSHHSSPKHHYHHHQSADHNHYHQPRRHHSPLHHKTPQPVHYSTPYQYKYPLLSTSVIKPTSPSRTPYVSSVTSGRIGGTYSGSVTDLSRSTQRTKYEYVTSSTIGGVSGVRPASSLPDLRQSSSSTSYIPRQPTASSSTYAHAHAHNHHHHQQQQGPRHAQSASDIMVGGYSSRGKRVSWREWRLNDESDSGGSTDSLIDEAEQVTTTRIDLSHADWDDRYERHRSRRRRTRSHQGFSSTWREHSESSRHSSSSRPYLPYRGDQLSPGQQVKVLAPGGGVAVARVVTNQRSAFLTGKSHRYMTSSGVISPASVTVILLSEPNRLQGTVVTVPLEKVLLAWPVA